MNSLYDAALAGQVFDFLSVKYVTVHVNKSPPALLRFVEEALPLVLVDEWHGADWSGAGSTIRLYRVKPTDATAWEVNLATPEGQLYLAEGWSAVATDGVRYATRPCAVILLNLPKTGGQLAFELFGPQQNVTIRLNGYHLAGAILPATDLRTTLPTPAGSTDGLIDRVELCFERRTPLAALVTPNEQKRWSIGNTGAITDHNILVQSAGSDVGDFAHVWVNGVDMSSNRRGYNLVALDPAGALLASRVFDTFAAADEAQAMADWLQQWPPGTIIAGAVRDEASSNLTEGAVAALNRIGVATDLRGRFRWGHAFLGVVGAPPGTAVEAADLLQPATIHVGAAVDAPDVYGGVGRIRFVANP
ncbi:MAG: interleukin-like EMT inducer domain-containing protein [Caldilineaceae bacterium]